jgi:hypothetical protein
MRGSSKSAVMVAMYPLLSSARFDVGGDSNSPSADDELVGVAQEAHTENRSKNGSLPRDIWSGPGCHGIGIQSPVWCAREGMEKLVTYTFCIVVVLRREEETQDTRSYLMVKEMHLPVATSLFSLKWTCGCQGKWDLTPSIGDASLRHGNEENMKSD